MVCYAEKQEKPFWFSSLHQIVHFDAIIFCRTFLELFWSVRVDRKKKSHYNSRVSLHEAPTKNIYCEYNQMLRDTPLIEKIRLTVSFVHKKQRRFTFFASVFDTWVRTFVYQYHVCLIKINCISVGTEIFAVVIAESKLHVVTLNRQTILTTFCSYQYPWVILQSVHT